MCGIAGILHADARPVDDAVLDAMTDALAHRGPDGRGTRILPGGGGRASAGLGHRRLAIVDLSERGAQPMCNEDGTIWLTFNGEIYNHRSIRPVLEDRGHDFASRTDSEVIIHAYEEWGKDCVRRLDGMFAFAVWDCARGELLLARDRWGKKPLHYWADNQSLAFASELGALLLAPQIPRRVNVHSLSRFLLHEYVPAPHSIIEGAAKVPAGHMLLWSGGAPRIERYFEPPFVDAYADLSLPEATARLEGLLKAAVEKRLMSDVPLGIFLSGGLDSSAITSLMAECLPPQDIRTFSIGFKEQSFDESPHARAVASAIGTRHHERLLTPQAMLDILPGVLDSLSEPMADPSILPTSLLSAFTREHVTVALGGDGGDELLAGYDPFRALTPARLLDALPRGLMRLATRAAYVVPASERNMGLVFKVQRFLRGMGYTGCQRQQAWLSAFLREEQQPLLHPDALDAVAGFDPLDDLAADCGARHFASDIDMASYFYLRYYMAGHILAKVDQASMSHSLEVRAPFLDTDLAAFACALPPRHRLRGMTSKVILRRLLRDRVPRSIAARGKKGFGIPLAAWLRGPLRPLVEDTLSPRALAAEPLFNTKAVRAIVDEHMSGRRDRRKELWTLVCFQSWERRFCP
jgi:asparagine synthase (glutamine-hydrolysing)